MARTGLTKSQVRTVRDRLQAEGRYPSVDAVRHALGDSGSKSTIHKYLKELRDEAQDAGARRGETEDALQAIVAQLADKLHAQAEARVRDLRAAQERAHEEALRAKDAELEALRRTVAALTARVTLLEAQALAGDQPRGWRSGRQNRGVDGFGRFDSALLSSRSGQGDSSPFDLIRAASRS
jgi:hypothetical protein